MALPSRDLPFMSLTAALASAGLSKVMNAKPLDLLVSRSFINSTSEMWPYLPNAASRDFSSVSWLSPPMKSFPGRSASTMSAGRVVGQWRCVAACGGVWRRRAVVVPSEPAGRGRLLLVGRRVVAKPRNRSSRPPLRRRNAPVCASLIWFPQRARLLLVVIGW